MTKGVVDLKDYIIQVASKSRCGHCGKVLFMLAPRHNSLLQFYYLCTCGRIVAAGDPDYVAEHE